VAAASGRCRSSLAYFRRVGELAWESTILASLSHAEFALGKSADAWEHALESLRIFDRIHTLAFFIPRTLAILALLYLDGGNIGMARDLQEIISLQPFWENSRWYADLYGNPVKAARDGAITQDQTAAHDLWEAVKILIKEIRP
jgi:hypothetical protein